MKTNGTENSFLLLYFQATAWADIAENDSTSPATSLYVSLHDTNPGEAGDQTTGETAYTNYVRKAVARTSGGWTVSNNNVVNAATITFATCGATGSTPMFWGIGTAVSGTGRLDFYGPLGNLPVPKCTVAAADLAGNTINAPGHGVTTDDRIVFYAVPNDTMPTGITEGTVYFVLAAGLTTDVFTISATSGGSAIDITAAGEMTAFRVTPLAITTGIAPEFAASAISLYED